MLDAPIFHQERKANKEKEREQLIAQQEKENLTGARNVEAEKLKKLLTEKQLAIFEVPSDGNCLYKAVEHQLSLQNITTTVEQLRKLTSEYMLSHADDFLPFLTNRNTDDIMTMDEFQHYCDDIVYTSTWGGQVELSALSHIYKVPIEIIQADGPQLVIGEEYEKSPLVLCYHRHIYGLGEHYNSTIAREDNPENAES
ncbi:OTU domain-containing protein 6B-like [Centruroides sculpturatus]|uniref:OTU domain-containing protein 6B-like n=1 Tax=Centruroides sculpturatus TaxID=218467 RepID=UPI000C6DF917|nr:OTU domain-containing protein 6B-like [Centruroides sculpturatus]